MAKAYDPSAIEPRWAQAWVEQKLFTPEVAAQHRPPDKGTFSLAIPPPNVTGSLHMGHMLEHTQIDALIRWRRMQGHRTLWLPGTDHAGIATQLVVERLLAEQSIDRKQLGREEFERRVWAWKKESGDTIKKQMVRLGASCDWTRERFTLEPALYRAVIEAFVRLYQEGLIYRGRYMVNWCPRCGTALSDLEVQHEERDARLYYLRYPVVGTSYHLIIATTRPETMLGDTGVAVHPEDDRYRPFVGQTVRLPLLNREIPVVADAYVDPAFGSGAVKVTPAHDPNDFEVGQRHHLAPINIFDDAARTNENAGPYAGLDRFEARKRVLADLEKQDLVEKVEPYRHAVGLCHRCKTLVEPRLSLQWFCKMQPLAEPAIEAVERGWIRVVPENNARVYLHWMRNLHDWCISRQLWWGHRIPVWHCAVCGEMTAARVYPAAPGLPPPEPPPVKCATCGSGRIAQDPDVLDTWFSSALWPFSTLGWPDETPDLAAFYPTTLMVNGFDILFFWDARMIMFGLHFLPRPQPEDRIPFRTLYIHQIVRDAERQKMSKTRGNVIDPLEVTEKYGTDAVRFTLAIMSAPGTDISLSEDRMRSYRAFANKIWNAARFLFVNLDKYETVHGKLEDLSPLAWRAALPPDLDLADRWIFSRLDRATALLNQALDGFRFHEAAHVIYHFFWHEFCDWYIEWVKPRLAASDRKAAKNAWRILFAVFDVALRLLHPFMPFITEELWHRLTERGQRGSIALEHFPKIRIETVTESQIAYQAEQEMALLQEAITALRNIRGEMKIDARRKIEAALGSTEPAVLALFRAHQDTIVRLAHLSQLELREGHLTAGGGVLRTAARFDASVPLAASDRDAERTRLQKEKEKLEAELARMREQLENQQFRARAPADVIRAMERRQAEYNSQYQKVIALLGTLETSR
ncbi:MAG: valine--tRNA ligase [Acidobacteria bacterium]|nr:valine--tRNA ligase [Acidobacteriota bacterium]